MAKYLPVCDGIIQSVSNTVSCTGGPGWFFVDATYLPGQFDISMIDVSLAGQYMATGFFIAAVPLLTGKAVELILRAMK